MHLISLNLKWNIQVTADVEYDPNEHTARIERALWVALSASAKAALKRLYETGPIKDSALSKIALAELVNKMLAARICAANGETGHSALTPLGARVFKRHHPLLRTLDY
jgi:hypothetical protein